MRYVNVFCMTNRLERKRSRIYDFVFLHRTFKNTKTQPRSVHTYIYSLFSWMCGGIRCEMFVIKQKKHAQTDFVCLS